MKLKHFTPDEFVMDTMSVYDFMDEEMLQSLDEAREDAGIPFVIISSFRSRAYNTEIGGAPNSAHLRGKAVDIQCDNNLDRYKMVTALLAAGFKRLGIGSDFIHADVDPDLPSPRIWTYSDK